MAAKKTVGQSVNWPTTVIILGLIGTLATLFAPLLAPTSLEVAGSGKQQDLRLEKIRTMIEELRAHSSKLHERGRLEQKADMMVIRKELTAIKENILQNARDISKARYTKAGYLKTR